MDLEATLCIAADHPAFAGHFPDRPILPGVVLLDAAVHALTEARRAASDPPQGGTPAVCQIISAKFLSPVSPGETLTISCSGTASGSTRFDISGGDRKVATGTLAWQAAP